MNLSVGRNAIHMNSVKFFFILVKKQQEPMDLNLMNVGSNGIVVNYPSGPVLQDFFQAQEIVFYHLNKIKVSTMPNKQGIADAFRYFMSSIRSAGLLHRIRGRIKVHSFLLQLT